MGGGGGGGGDGRIMELRQRLAPTAEFTVETVKNVK